MSSAFEREQDREELAAPNVQDAGEGAGHEERATQENAQVELRSVFDDDSDDDDDDLEDAPGNDATAPYNEGDSWLGATNDGNAAQNNQTHNNRPSDLVLDQSRKRKSDSDETEDESEGEYSPELSPRTYKRLCTEAELGFSYEYRPRSLYALDGGDEIVLNLLPHYVETLKPYRTDSPRRPVAVKGFRMGQAMPAYLDLPRRPSPLGQDAHRDGLWKGISAVPLPSHEEEEEYVPSPPVRSASDHYPNVDEDDDEDDHDSHPARPDSPSPDSDDEEFIAERERNNSTADEGQDRHSSDSNSHANDGYQQDADNTDSTTRRPSLTFADVLSMKPLMKNWAGEDEEDDAAFLNTFTETSSALTDDSTIDENTSTEYSDQEQQDGGALQRYDSNDDNITSAMPSTVPDSNTASPQTRPASLQRHPSSNESGNEVGQLSKPLPLGDEIARLKWENAKLALQIIKDQDQCKRRERNANREFNELLASYNRLQDSYDNLQTSHRACGAAYSKLRDVHYELQYDYDALKGECLANKQRAEYDAEQLAAERKEQDLERLAFISGLQREAKSMRTWAERLDDDAEPMRIANDALTAKLEAAEKAKQALNTQLEDANTTIEDLRAQVHEAAEKGVKMVQLYRQSVNASAAVAASQPGAAAAATASQPPSNPSSSSTTSSSPPRSPRATPAPLPPSGETRAAREARWRNLAANRATRDAQRQARRDSDAQHQADRELRLQAYTAATGRLYVEVDASVRRSALLRIVEESRMRAARIAQ